MACRMWRAPGVVGYECGEGCHVSPSPALGRIRLSLSSYRLRSSLSTHPPLGKGLCHWLCRCTEKTLLSTRSSPPPSSRPTCHGYAFCRVALTGEKLLLVFRIRVGNSPNKIIYLCPSFIKLHQRQESQVTELTECFLVPKLTPSPFPVTLTNLRPFSQGLLESPGSSDLCGLNTLMTR